MWVYVNRALVEPKKNLRSNLINVSFSHTKITKDSLQLSPRTPVVQGLGLLPQITETPLAESQILTKFRSRRFSRFTFFFISNAVDIPTCFRGVSSLLRRKSSALSTYFITSLLRHGNYERLLGKMSRSTFFLSARPNNFQIPTTPFMSGDDLYTRLSLSPYNTFTKNDDLSPLLLVDGGEGDWENYDFWKPILSSNSATIVTHLRTFGGVLLQIRQKDLQPTLLIKVVSTLDILNRWGNIYNASDEFNYVTSWESLTRAVNPIFSYFIYKTSKTVWKFSRRKADRFFLMWKYVPPHKRGFLILRWLRHDLNLLPQKNIQARIQTLLEDVLSGESEKSLIQRRTFIHNYVFREYRFSLMRQFRTQK